LSSADLSVGGEPVDVALQSEELAARYAHLGLSAQLIGKAIARAAGMVGVALDGAGEEMSPPVAGARQTHGASASVNGFHANGTAVGATRVPAESDQGAALRRVFIRE
jgi:hypothetical protein